MRLWSIDGHPLTLPRARRLRFVGTSFVAKVSPGLNDPRNSHDWTFALEVALLCLLRYVETAPAGAEYHVGRVIGFRCRGEGDLRWDKKFLSPRYDLCRHGQFPKIIPLQPPTHSPPLTQLDGKRQTATWQWRYVLCYVYTMTPIDLCPTLIQVNRRGKGRRKTVRILPLPKSLPRIPKSHPTRRRPRLVLVMHRLHLRMTTTDHCNVGPPLYQV